MIGWTILLAVFAVMLLFAVSVVVTARRKDLPGDHDNQE